MAKSSPQNPEEPLSPKGSVPTIPLGSACPRGGLSGGRRLDRRSALTCPACLDHNFAGAATFTLAVTVRRGCLEPAPARSAGISCAAGAIRPVSLAEP